MHFHGMRNLAWFTDFFYQVFKILQVLQKRLHSFATQFAINVRDLTVLSEMSLWFVTLRGGLLKGRHQSHKKQLSKPDLQPKLFSILETQSDALRLLTLSIFRL